jgi:hypothetical protein
VTLVSTDTAVSPGSVPSRSGVAIVAAGGTLALFVARPLLGRAGTPAGAIVVLFATLLVIGLCWPIAEVDVGTGWRVSIAVVAVGIGAFALGRVIGGGRAPLPATVRALTLGTFAAVAEEAFFRRLVYAVLVPGGVLLAVVGSASLFAVAHVTVYGWWVLPLDLAAGLVLSWQRAATGSWRASALTHVAANVLVLL